MKKSKKDEVPKERKNLPLSTVTIVLTEAGYRCAVPTCRGILALDIHHILEVSAGGGGDPANLIALCPTCHALYHRGTISQESIHVYKAMLVTLNNPNRLSADILLLLYHEQTLTITADGLLQIANLLTGRLVEVRNRQSGSGMVFAHPGPDLFVIGLTRSGQALVNAWIEGRGDGIVGVLSGASGS